MNIANTSTALALCTTLLLAGCAELPKFGKKKVQFPEATEKDPVAEVVCIWQPAHGRGLNGMPSRGIAGQILMFNRGNPSPVTVDGDLRIYLFDNHGPQEQWSEPIHIFDIPASQLSSHVQSSSFGAGYQIFVPYVREGNEQVTCSLQVRLTPETGPVVHSQLSSVTLPGTIESDGQTVERSGKTIQASYSKDESKASGGSEGRQLSVRTISPREFFAPPASAPNGGPATASSATTDSAGAASPASAANSQQQQIERLEKMVADLLKQNQAQAAALQRVQHQATRESSAGSAPSEDLTARSDSAAAANSPGTTDAPAAARRPHPLRD